MINPAALSAYNNLARMSSNINRFISQATMAKTTITRNVTALSLKNAGIGRNVDMLV